jgi:hypothetical protein
MTNIASRLIKFAVAPKTIFVNQLFLHFKMSYTGGHNVVTQEDFLKIQAELTNDRMQEFRLKTEALKKAKKEKEAAQKANSQVLFKVEIEINHQRVPDLPQ